MNLSSSNKGGEKLRALPLEGSVWGEQEKKKKKKKGKGAPPSTVPCERCWKGKVKGGKKPWGGGKRGGGKGRKEKNLLLRVSDSGTLTEEGNTAGIMPLEGKVAARVERKKGRD